MVIVDIYQCPACGDDMAIINLVDYITTGGVKIGKTLVKCRGGCSKNKILYSKRVFRRRQQIPDSVFLEIIKNARDNKKRISHSDKDRELFLKLKIKERN